MSRGLYTNNAIAQLSAGISAAAVTAVLQVGQGALFPAIAAGSSDYFWLTLADAATGAVLEVVLCTARAGDTLTIVRAQQGTIAHAYVTGDGVTLRTTATGLGELAASSEIVMPPVTCTVAAGVITAAFAPVPITFRNTPLTAGGSTTIDAGTALSIVMPSIAVSLGTPTGRQATIAILAFNNGGAIVLGFANTGTDQSHTPVGAVDLTETKLASPTTISVGATSNALMYSASAVAANSPYRVLGTFTGVWTSGTGWTITDVQPAGGAFKLPLISSVQLYQFTGYGTTNTAVPTNATVLVNQGKDIVFADSVTLGTSCTIATAGTYAVSYSVCTSVATGTGGITINSTTGTSGSLVSYTGVLQTVGGRSQGNCSWTGPLNAGDVVRPIGSGAMFQDFDYFSITRVD